MPTELMRVHPDCPKPDISDDVSLTSWDIRHVDRGKVSFSHISKERWGAIFGKPNECCPLCGDYRSDHPENEFCALNANP
jgi:hypothetical protein